MIFSPSLLAINIDGFARRIAINIIIITCIKNNNDFCNHCNGILLLRYFKLRFHTKVLEIGFL